MDESLVIQDMISKILLESRGMELNQNHNHNQCYISKTWRHKNVDFRSFSQAYQM